MKTTSFESEDFNIDFNKPNHIIYFNNSGKTCQPRSVEEVGRKALSTDCNPWNLGAECTDEMRSLFSQIVNASSKDIAIVPSTGFAMTLVAKNLFSFSKGSSFDQAENENTPKVQRLLILQDEFSSEVYAWQEFRDQVEIIIVPHPKDDGGWTDLIIQHLENESVDICCVPQVHWSDGSYIDLKLVGHHCKLHGIVLVVDGTQSVGIMPMDVKSMQCDVLACSVHKWLLGPHNTSLMYIHPKYHDTWMPLDQHERSRVAFQNEVFDATENNIGGHGYPEQFVAGAARCDSGGKKNQILQPMICEGLRTVLSLNLNSAQCFLRGVTDQVLEGGKFIGFDVQPGPRCGHIIGLRPKLPALVDFLSPEKMVEIATRLREKHIFLAVRNGAFRISPYLNTTQRDIILLLEALKEECQVAE